MRTDPAMPWPPVLAGGAATLVGNGIARFGYAPLLPVLIAQGWFAPGEAAYLGAANLLGYFVGAVAAQAMAARLGVRLVLRGAMLAASASLLACCVPMPFAWFFVWRLVSGIAGGLLMILAPATILQLVPAGRRGLAGGLIFTGVGLGIAGSGTLVPLLLHWGLTTAWLSLGLLSLLLTALTWTAWPGTPTTAAPAAPAGRPLAGLWAINVNYGLCAVGLVPHMVFLVDYVARGQGRGLAAGGLMWVLFGLGALSGAVAVGRLADRIGPAASMRAVIAVQSGCVLALAFNRSPWISAAAALLAGMCLMGVTTAMIGRVQLVAGADLAARQRGWTQATLAWAIGQAAAAYGLAWLYARTGGYAALLATAGAALLLAAAIEAWIAIRPVADPA